MSEFYSHSKTLLPIYLELNDIPSVTLVFCLMLMLSKYSVRWLTWKQRQGTAWNHAHKTLLLTKQNLPNSSIKFKTRLLC